MTRTRTARPLLPHEELAAQAAHPKPQYRDDLHGEAIDTTELPHRKIHPFRDSDHLHRLTFKTCAIAGLVDQLTEQRHICWSPPECRGLSDPAHLEKAISGRTKRDDRYAIPLCRLAHNMQEGDDARFARRFGIDTKKLAEDLYAEHEAERERRR